MLKSRVGLNNSVTSFACDKDAVVINCNDMKEGVSISIECQNSNRKSTMILANKKFSDIAFLQKS